MKRRLSLLNQRHIRAPLLVLLAGVATTLIAAWLLATASAAYDRERFEGRSEMAAAALLDRMDTQIALLRGGAALFAASEDVSPEEFAAYVSRVGVGTRYQGVQGVGFSVKADGDDAALAADMQARGLEGFRPWPERQAGRERHSIAYLWPMGPRNQAAIGYDMYSEPTRREAMARARDGAVATLSGKVVLVQEIDPAKQPGFLIYAPVYRGGRAPATVEARREALIGFVYSPLRAHDLLSTVFPPDEERVVDVAVYDGAPRPENLLYATAAPHEARLQSTRTVEVAGRVWTLHVASTEAFEVGSNRDQVRWVLGGGLLITLLLAAAVAAQARAAMAAEDARAELSELNRSLEARVAERTAELTAATERLRAEAAQREAAEARVRQIQKMESIGQLAGGIAHDFNNMLAIVIGSLDIAKRRLDKEPAKARTYIDNALEGARRAGELTARLLAFSRQQALDPKVVDVNALVRGMSDMLRRTLGQKVEVEVVLAAGLWPTLADAGELENALVNLAVNARDAMAQSGGGRLTVETYNASLDEAYAAGHEIEPGQYVAIAVTDTGQGMPQEIVDRAFDPFFTTKEVGKGTGLGLSQVYGFVRQSGGHIKIYSEVGVGTTIKLYLPRSAGKAAPRRRKAEGEPPRAKPGEVVLVVEDEGDVRQVSVDALREFGYQVAQAPNAEQALAELSTLPRVDLLFTDLVMPGMDGGELAEAAIARRPGLKVLFTTGYARNAMMGDGPLGPNVRLLQKPFTVAALAACVRDALDH